VSLHSLLPLVACLLNLALAALAIFRNPGSRLNRLFTYFVAALAVWNFGVFMLRSTADPRLAFFWEIVIHIGIISVPVLYYHFVLIFLERTTENRRSLGLGYGLLLAFLVVNLSGSPLFMKGVISTYWGWAPATGPLYMPFFVYLYAFFIVGLVRLGKSYPFIESSFRRNRALLIMLGTVTTIGGGLTDFLRFIVAKYLPAADRIYPVGIPANMLCALLLGMSIVRYRMFDVDVAVKKFAVYGGVGVVVTSVLAVLTWTLERYFDLERESALWAVVPLSLMITLLLSPIGGRMEVWIERAIFSRRRGCYDTLLALSKRMGAILDFDALVDTLVSGVVRGIPVTHCVLLIHDDSARSFLVYRKEASGEAPPAVRPLDDVSPIVRWLKTDEGLLVKEEAKLNPRIAAYFEAAEAELDAIPAAIIVPLKVERTLNGIMFVGEKLSGEVFDDQELEVLTLLANQAAISLENARLYLELRRSNVQLMEASRLKSQFLASMSHELRTPLNAIIGFSKVLLNQRDGTLNDRQETYLKTVYNSSTHLLQLINSVLDISRIEAGKHEMQREDVDLGALVDECLQTSGALVRNKPLRLERDLVPDLPAVPADRMKVKQILLNLLSNAIKFTPGGRITVRARLEPHAVHLSVSDTGIGIRKEDQTRLFQPFERGGSALANEAGGTGLGLAISKKFVELHGGQMWMESEENRGSTFHFTLPLQVPAAAHAASV
jgi:signal transduction histidine kinase